MLTGGSRPERWLVTGGEGQVGGYVVRALCAQRPYVEMLALPALSNRPHSRHVDVTDIPQLREVVESYKPTHIVHLAGVSSPRAAQLDPEGEKRRECEPVEYLAHFARRSRAWMLLTSTDFVWSGTSSRPYRETDIPVPINAYGAIKLAAERIVLDAGAGMVARCSLMYGRPLIARPTTWTWIAELLANGGPVPACFDEYRSPMSLADAAAVLVAMGADRYGGLLHVAGPDTLTAEDMIRRLAAYLNVEPRLSRVSRFDLTPGVARPGNATMEVGRLREIAPDLLPRTMNATTIGEVFGCASVFRSCGRVPRRPDSVFGVVIPAYHGAETIHRSLGSLASQYFNGALHVVVAVNDGRDDTARVAWRLSGSLRDAGARCTIIETEPGRASALNAAERILGPGARLYLDQDARLSPDVIAALAARLDPATPIEFAAPTPRLAPLRKRFARAYYQTWTELPYVRNSPATMGAYAVSAEGRARWGDFPTIHSDDKFARLHFAPRERALISGTYEVLAPENVRELVRARRRYIRGNQELEVSGVVPRGERDVPRYAEIVPDIARHPSKWPAFAAFLTIYGAAVALEGIRGYVAASD